MTHHLEKVSNPTATIYKTTPFELGCLLIVAAIVGASIALIVRGLIG